MGFSGKALEMKERRTSADSFFLSSCFQHVLPPLCDSSQTTPHVCFKAQTQHAEGWMDVQAALRNKTYLPKKSTKRALAA